MGTMFRSKLMIQILVLFPFAAHAAQGTHFWQCEHGEWVDKVDDRCDRDGVDSSQPACKPNLWLCGKCHWNVFGNKDKGCAKTQCNRGYDSRMLNVKKYLNYEAMLQAKLAVTTAMWSYPGATIDARGNVVDVDGNRIDPLVYSDAEV